MGKLFLNSENMQKLKVALTSNTRLTHNVYELIYEIESSLQELPIAGQYVMFQLAKGVNRAYSFTDFDEKSFTLIVERIPEGK